MKILLRKNQKVTAWVNTLNIPLPIMTSNITALLAELMDDCPATAYQFDEVAAAISTLPVREIDDIPDKPDITIQILSDRIIVTRNATER
jgi:energy-converting hydrogenase Eha subunit A